MYGSSSANTYILYSYRLGTTYIGEKNARLAVPFSCLGGGGRVAVSSTFAMVGEVNMPPSNPKTRRPRRLWDRRSKALSRPVRSNFGIIQYTHIPDRAFSVHQSPRTRSAVGGSVTCALHQLALVRPIGAVGAVLFTLHLAAVAVAVAAAAAVDELLTRAGRRVVGVPLHVGHADASVGLGAAVGRADAAACHGRRVRWSEVRLGQRYLLVVTTYWW